MINHTKNDSESKMACQPIQYITIYIANRSIYFTIVKQEVKLIFLRDTSHLSYLYHFPQLFNYVFFYFILIKSLFYPQMIKI